MATLKISDLSVGDWVMNHRGYPTKVQVITSEGNLLCGEIDAKSEHCTHLWAQDIKPIPITAEILEKNGFESTTKPNVFTLTHGKLQLYVSNELDGWHMSFVNFMERLCILQVIRKSYIHELQHALRFAGVDKEINL